MTVLVLNESTHAILKDMQGPEARKVKITCCVQNTTGSPLRYKTVLASGDVEVESGIIPPGFRFVIQPNGEMHVQSRRKGVQTVSTFEALQVADRPMTHAQALAKREERKRADMPITPPEAFDGAIALLQELNPGVDLSGLSPSWYDAKGYISVFRLPEEVESFHMSKLHWDGVQDYKDHVLIYNHLTSEMYAIKKGEFIGEWYLCLSPSLKGEDAWNAVPALSMEQVGQLLLYPEIDMNGANVHGLKGRDLAVAHYMFLKGMQISAAKVIDFASRIVA